MIDLGVDLYSWIRYLTLADLFIGIKLRAEIFPYCE